MSYQRILEQVTEALNAPCATEQDQRVHDNLTRFDALREAGCTAMCAAGQVWGEGACKCGGGA